MCAYSYVRLSLCVYAHVYVYIGVYVYLKAVYIHAHVYHEHLYGCRECRIKWKLAYDRGSKDVGAACRTTGMQWRSC